MFSLATINDLIGLRGKYREHILPGKNEWGLKQFGMLFCLDSLLQLPAGSRVLEVGVGRSRFFDKTLPDSLDYWAIDSSGFYEAEGMALAVAARTRTTFVDGLLGGFLPSLPAESFDAVFSISVLEHVLPDGVAAVCKDMARVLKSGGLAIHSLDLPPSGYATVGRPYEAELPANGLAIGAPDVDYGAMAAKGLLSEPVDIVFNHYGKKKPDDPYKTRRIAEQMGTIKVVARKGAAQPQ